MFTVAEWERSSSRFVFFCFPRKGAQAPSPLAPPSPTFVMIVSPVTRTKKTPHLDERVQRRARRGFRITAVSDAAAGSIGLRARSRGAQPQRRAILPSSMPTRRGNRAGRAMALKITTTYATTYIHLYAEFVLEGSWLMPNKHFSRSRLGSLPCGEGSRPSLPPTPISFQRDTL